MQRPVDDVVPVVIVGAGPTGVTAALLLADYGVRCLVLDRWDGVYAQPRAVHLDDEVCRILARVGVSEGFAGISRPCLGLRLVDDDLQTLAEFSRSGSGGKHGYPQANMFDQPDLEQLLRDEVAHRPTVDVRGGSVVTGVHQEADHVRVEYADQHSGERYDVLARYVLGCDGANSLTRTEMGSGMTDLGFEQQWLVVDVRSDVELAHWEGVHQVCDPVRAGTYMRIGKDRYRWEFRLLPAESAADFTAPGAVRELIRRWTPEVDDGYLSVVRVAEYTFRAQVADRWRDRRVFLLGDAAHLTPPFIGQGLGAGLRDAANLAWKLAGVLQGGLDDDCLDSYQVERKGHAKSMIRLAMLVGTAMTGGGRAGKVVRRIVSPYLHLVPGLRARILDSTTPRLHRSVLASRALVHLPLGGALAPNARLADGSRLDDVRAAFVLLTLDAVPTAPVEERGGVVVRVGRGDELGRWLRRGGARAAVLRPDSTVLRASRRAASLLTDLPGFPLPAALPNPDPLADPLTTEPA